MYTLLLATHSLLRWLVLAAGVAVVARALGGLRQSRGGSRHDDRLARLFVVSLDVQTLVGLVLYLATSPITTAALRNPGAALGDTVARFWFLEHPVLMLGALALAHVGLVRMRRESTPARRRGGAALFFGLALVLLLVGIPWPFARVSRPLWP